jgi:hypothetical protein
MTFFVSKKNQKIAIFTLFFVFYISQCLAGEQVAIVISASGKAFAGVRALTRKSPIYQGETINTDVGSKVSFKFTDGGVVSLAEKSSYLIKNYAFNSSQKLDVFEAKLIKGGLKTITGKIGKEAIHSADAVKAGIPKEQQTKPATYKLEAGIATIGVRGTKYSARLEEHPPDLMGLQLFSNHTSNQGNDPRPDVVIYVFDRFRVRG